MQQQQVISIPGHEINNPIPIADKINRINPAIIATIHPIIETGISRQAKQHPRHPKQNTTYKKNIHKHSRQDRGGGKTAIENRNIKNAGIEIDTQIIGTANPNNAKAKQTLTPTTDRGISKAHKKQGMHGKLQQVKNPAVKMQSPVQNSNPRQTRDAMPPRPRTVISATPASKTQVVTPQIKNDPAVMIDKNKNRIRIKRKNKAGNTIQSSMNASNPTMIYLLF